MATLATHAQEQSTYIITVSFADEDGSAVTPNTVVWSLLDANSQIVNSREQVSATPAASIDLVLSGADLASSGKRTIIVEADYDSAAGSGLTLTGAVHFWIDALDYIA